MTAWKVDLRWHDGHLTDRTETASAETAEAAYRALLRRDDLDGEPVAARMVSPVTRKSIYYSRFDGVPGTLRIHPDAPIDPFAESDLTAIAAAWRPQKVAAHDWRTDPRPIYECFGEWRARYGWKVAEAAERIGEKSATVQQWSVAGREPRNTMPARIIMTLIDRLKTEGPGFL